MKYTDKALKAQTVQIPFLMRSGELIILLLALKYFVNAGGNKIAVSDAKWLPMGIIGSYYYRGPK